MAVFGEAELARLERAAALIFEAEDKLPVLKTLAWDRALAERFFSAGAAELPAPVYARPDTEPCKARLVEAGGLISGSSPVHDWLRRSVETIERTAALLDSVGTPAFYTHSRALYGAPDVPIADGRQTALGLARQLGRVLSEFDGESLHLLPPEMLGAEALKAKLDAKLPQYFGDEAPRVEVTANVNAKAAAGSDYIKLRADAVFCDTDFIQLLQHEALVHIATGLNGRRQPRFRLLAESHPGNARTQEGLAVFAEFISGALDPRRLKRLADRTLAIDMAARGADFIELYRFFLARNPGDPPFEAFESARRVVRGGVISGGAPFTKDSVYLGGLLEVHNYLRAAVHTGDITFIRLLFVGKIDLSDLEAMKLLLEEGLIGPPRIMPPWAVDLRFLVSYLAYSTFLNGISLADVDARYRGVFGSARGDGPARAPE